MCHGILLELLDVMGEQGYKVKRQGCAELSWCCTNLQYYLGTGRRGDNFLESPEHGQILLCFPQCGGF